MVGKPRRNSTGSNNNNKNKKERKPKTKTRAGEAAVGDYVQIYGEPIADYYLQYIPQEDVERARCCYCLCKRRSIRRTFMYNSEGDLIEALTLQVLWILVMNVISHYHEHALVLFHAEDIAFFTVYAIMTLFSFILAPISVQISKRELGSLIIFHIFCSILVTVCQVVLFTLAWLNYNVKTYTFQFIFIGGHYLYNAWHSHCLYRQIFHLNVAWDDPFRRPRSNLNRNRNSFSQDDDVYKKLEGGHQVDGKGQGRGSGQIPTLQSQTTETEDSDDEYEDSVEYENENEVKTGAKTESSVQTDPDPDNDSRITGSSSLNEIRTASGTSGGKGAGRRGSWT